MFEADLDGARYLGGRAESAPVKLTNGPMRCENAVPSPLNHLVFALGTPPTTGELVRFDPRCNSVSSIRHGHRSGYTLLS